jgi:glycosyltransferase involved in cell wall biosynthesis
MPEPASTHNPKFSIVIATYKRPIILKECLEALSYQLANEKSFESIEVILVNDGGNKESYNKIGSLDDRLVIRYFYQEHKGPAAARNLGIKEARGKIVLFLDDDSVPTRDWLKVTIASWEKFYDFDGIGGYIISESTANIYCRINTDFFNWYLEQHVGSKSSAFLPTCNAGYKKAVLDKVGGFDESFKRAAGEDRDLSLKILKVGGKLKLDKKILVYHERDLDFHKFSRKHFDYGKAAYKLYTTHPGQKRLPIKSYINFYKSILRNYKPLKEKIISFLLLTACQIFTLVGYIMAKFTKREKG